MVKMYSFFFASEILIINRMLKTTINTVGENCVSLLIELVASVYLELLIVFLQHYKIWFHICKCFGIIMVRSLWKRKIYTHLFLEIVSDCSRQKIESSISCISSISCKIETILYKNTISFKVTPKFLAHSLYMLSLNN